MGITYRYKQFNVGLMGLNPFSNNYKVGTENFSSIASSRNWGYFKESSGFFAFKFAWNLNFGRKYESAQRRIHNEDNSAGTLKSGK
ncbi:hypothetical protein [Bacteroides bouchesdurhonensis]|uniref:hypothetical protein n=1 Tax=Bacteroides bouchesdurhonensis TaxID=1841855 RepID=UPI00097FA19F|nr:hypothetical protein [Bacteroides bouchesdurhonensis]